MCTRSCVFSKHSELSGILCTNMTVCVSPQNTVEQWTFYTCRTIMYSSGEQRMHLPKITFLNVEKFN